MQSIIHVRPHGPIVRAHGRAPLRRGRTVAGRWCSGIVAEQRGDQRGPAGLVAGAQAGAGVAVEVLVEGYVVAPVRVGLEVVVVAEDGPPPAAPRVAQENARQPACQLLRYLVQRVLLARTGRHLDLERLAVVAAEVLE